MKKFLYTLGIVALLASCTDDYKDWADLKTNPAEEPVNVELSVTSVEGLTVDYNDTELPDLITVANVAVVSSVEDVTANYTATLNNEDYSKTVNLPVSLNEEGNALVVTKNDLYNAAKSLFGQTGEEMSALVIVDAALALNGAVIERAGQASLKVIIPKPEFEEYIYGIGNGTGWSRVCPLRSPNFDGLYTGYIYIDGEFKFRSHEDSWDAPDWGGGADPGTLQEGGNITEPVATGYYAITVNLATMTWELGTKINNIGMIGSFNGWGGDEEMTYNPATGAWEGELTLTEDSEVKFRANYAWAINWGGSFDELTQDGSNLQVPAGTYKVQLFAFCDGKAHCTFTAQ